ncbi:MAG: triose-phosphate isomerase [Bacillota bacterium]
MKLIIAANWKMHKTAEETSVYCRNIRQNEAQFKGAEVLICPPFTAIPAAASELRGSMVKLGAQNMHWEPKGAQTGEISASMLLEFGVEYVIIGHSERRHLMGEDNNQIRLKVEAAFKNNLRPILCVGETEDQRDQGITEKVIEEQLSGSLKDLEIGRPEDLVIAYEPVWAIGTGKAASADDAEQAATYIKQCLEQLLTTKNADKVRIQYGGSVKAENIDSFVSSPGVHGALVGGASLEVDSFSSLIEAAGKAVNN